MGAVDHDGLQSRLDGALPWLTPHQRADVAGVLNRLIDVRHPDQVYLFGSQARGEARPDSDVDLFVVVPPCDGSPYQTARDAYQATRRHTIWIDVHVITRDDLAWRLRSPASLPCTVLREGQLLYAAPNADLPEIPPDSGRQWPERDTTDGCRMTPESLREAHEWIDGADRDLIVARRMLEAPPVPVGTIYHAQQAAEKALKAFLTLHGRPFARTHELPPLIAKCERIDPAFAAHRAAAATLSPYFIAGRYPNAPKAPTLVQAQQALPLATDIVELVRESIATASP